MPAILSPALQKGDLIALVFPASYLDKKLEGGEEVVNRKAAWLESQGFRTIQYPSQVHIYGYLAGTDRERADALMAAWKNPEVKAIWCFRGGYGTPRMLDLLDYNWIKDHPKIFIGMSDITALHQAIQMKTGLVTFLAPVLNFFDEPESSFDSAYAFTELNKVLVENKRGEIFVPEGLKVISAGKAAGQLIGGNITLITILCGTPWQLNTEGKVLVLEDVNAPVYSVDRMLWQLKASGLLDKPAAVILGGWTDCTSTYANGFTLDEVFAQYFKDAPYPVISNFPTGHDTYQTTLPLNIAVEVDTAFLKVELLEGSVLVNQ